ncbi:MAG: TIGR00304 family membrane protein [Candidatus Thorarchaeota archaeon]
MQLGFSESLGWLLIIGGILLIFLAIILSIRRDNVGTTRVKTESRGIIFLGPIPIVWGYGKGSRIVSVIGLIAILIFILYFFVL